MPSIQEITSLFSQNFTVTEMINLSKPLGLFIIGLAVYAFFIFKFYRFLARREIFQLKILDKDSGYKGFRAFIHWIGYLFKYLIVFPLFLGFWVIVLSAILAFLAKNNTIESILLISVALVGVIRVMAYYDEDLSKDLAKMMPFALLGVFLVDISYFSASNSLNSIMQIFISWKLLVYYLIILILIEFILRILYLIFGSLKKDD